MADLRKIVDEAIQIIGDIPYKHYTFLAIGPVPGGIEHLNSTGFGFSSTDFHRRDRLLRMYTFLSHEYFHHYNAKRIRPIELGPFDYYAGSKTTMLWIAEGFTNYYDELIVKRAGLMTNEEYLKSISARIQSFENKPGRLFQTAADASYSTWEDGPFGRTGDDAYKTISVYEKGSLLGFVLDLEIRYYTKNKKSLDDVMRCLYTEYYQHKKRGFTEDEFRIAVEHISGKKMTEFFDYVNTLKPINYQKYLNYAGLKLVENSVELPEPYTGLSFRLRNDTIHVSRVDWQSPAWEAGIRSNDKIFMVNDQHANMESLATAWKSNAPLKLMVVQNRKQQTLTLQPGKKTERQFSIQPYPKPNKLQREILGDWIKTDN
jgi:predicted metalloprotease with PDZ domain